MGHRRSTAFKRRFGAVLAGTTAMIGMVTVSLIPSSSAAPATPSPAPSVEHGRSSAGQPDLGTDKRESTYHGSAEEAKTQKAFFEAVLKSMVKKQAANPRAQAVTVVYSAANAPTFRSQIAWSTQIWNSSVSSVKLQEGSNPDFTYHEGNHQRGSHAATDGRGRGYIFLDYQQNQQYDPTRVTTHETGHALGLPDNYSGPCSELMSGGGAGPSCRNTMPNAQERARVDALWRSGVTAALAKFDKTDTRVRD